MIPWSILPLAAVAGLAAGMAAVSFAVLARARSLVRRADRQIADAQANWTTELETLRREVGGVAVHLEELDKQTAVTSPKPCMNIGRRAQALRLHRRGETASQIATALNTPQQEIELLLKVHQIMLRAI
jgi:hypothetical protein